MTVGWDAIDDSDNGSLPPFLIEVAVNFIVITYFACITICLLVLMPSAKEGPWVMHASMTLTGNYCSLTTLSTWSHLHGLERYGKMPIHKHNGFPT